MQFHRDVFQGWVLFDPGYVSQGVPLFLANGAISAWIKFYSNSSPPILVAILHGLAIIYLLVAHARWFKHLFSVNERSSLQVRAPSVPRSLAWCPWRIEIQKHVSLAASHCLRRTVHNALAWTWSFGLVQSFTEFVRKKQRLSRDSILQDAELQHLPAGLPFDWHLPSVQGKSNLRRRLWSRSS